MGAAHLGIMHASSAAGGNAFCPGVLLVFVLHAFQTGKTPNRKLKDLPISLFASSFDSCLIGSIVDDHLVWVNRFLSIRPPGRPSSLQLSSLQILRQSSDDQLLPTCTWRLPARTFRNRDMHICIPLVPFRRRDSGSNRS